MKEFWRPAGGAANLERREGDVSNTKHYQIRSWTSFCCSSHLRTGPWTPCSLGRLCLGRGASLVLKPLCCSPGKPPGNLGAGAPAAPTGLTVPG